MLSDEYRCDIILDNWIFCEYSRVYNHCYRLLNKCLCKKRLLYIRNKNIRDNKQCLSLVLMLYFRWQRISQTSKQNMIYLPLDFFKIKNWQKKPRKFDVSDTDLIITIGWLLILPCNNNSNNNHSLWFFILIAVPYPQTRGNKQNGVAFKITTNKRRLQQWLH